MQEAGSGLNNISKQCAGLSSERVDGSPATRTGSGSDAAVVDEKPAWDGPPQRGWGAYVLCQTQAHKTDLPHPFKKRRWGAQPGSAGAMHDSARRRIARDRGHVEASRFEERASPSMIAERISASLRKCAHAQCATPSQIAPQGVALATSTQE